MRATRAIIRLDYLRQNIAAAKSLLPQDAAGNTAALCLPVKADAYGHGAVPVAKAALEAGVSCLGVSNVAEGVELRNSGVTAPILLFSAPLPREQYQLVEAALSAFVPDIDTADAYNEAANRAGKVLPVHLKIDTGMGRLGCRPEMAAELAAYIDACPYLSLAGTATHLACADGLEPAAEAFTRAQLARFHGALDAIKQAGIDPGIVHAANSGAVLRWPEAAFGMVRPGIMLYGYPPNPELAGVVDLKPVMQLVTQIAFLKEVRKGEALSYGATWTAGEDTMVATLPVGYGDGLPRALSGSLSVRIGGRDCPVRGRICMDQCMVELGPLDEGEAPRRWDEVVVFGCAEDGAACDAAALAARVDTIPYEITCGITKRVPRVYI